MQSFAGPTPLLPPPPDCVPTVPPAPRSQERKINDPAYACLSNLTSAQVRNMYLNGTSMYGRSCLNEPYRILSGVADEADINALSEAAAPGHAAHLERVLALTLKHLAQCVPIVLEKPESLRLARYYFPQLMSAFAELPHCNKGKAARCPLSPDAQAQLGELAAAETLLYRAAVLRVDHLLAALPAGAGLPDEHELQEATRDCSPV